MGKPDLGPAATHCHAQSQPRSRRAIPHRTKSTYPAPTTGWASGVWGGSVGCGGAAWGVGGRLGVWGGGVGALGGARGMAGDSVVAPTATGAGRGSVGQTCFNHARRGAIGRRRWWPPSHRDRSPHLRSRAPAPSPFFCPPLPADLCWCPLSTRRVTLCPRTLPSAPSFLLAQPTLRERPSPGPLPDSFAWCPPPAMRGRSSQRPRPIKPSRLFSFSLCAAGATGARCRTRPCGLASICHAFLHRLVV